MNFELERAVIARFKDGEQDAFCELFDAHQSRVIHMALQILRNEQLALDAAQDVFLRAYEVLPKWRGDARFSTWLYRTALNVCYERNRAEEKQRKILGRYPSDDVFPSPEVGAISAEIMSRIGRAVESLPPRQREIFILKQYEGMLFVEIASLLDITDGSAKASYHKAVLALRMHLKDLAPEHMQSTALSWAGAEIGGRMRLVDQAS